MNPYRRVLLNCSPLYWLRQLAQEMGLHPCRIVSCASLDTIYGVDPFYSEIQNDHTKFWMCEQCVLTSAMEI